MKAKELISRFPDISLIKNFEDRCKLTKIDQRTMEIQKKRYSKIFDFEEILSNLKEILNLNPKIEIDDYDYKKFEVFFNLIQRINSSLEKIDTTTNLPEQVFTKTNEELNKYFLKEKGLEEIPIDKHLSGLKSLSTRIELKIIMGGGMIKLINEINKDRDEIIRALESIKNWNKQEAKAFEIIGKKQSINFEKAANEHRNWKIWFWLFFGIINAVFVFLISIELLPFFSRQDFKHLPTEIISRFSTLAIPSYFMLLCINQFLRHRKLHDSYKYRNISLETMNDLLKLHSEHWEKEKILEKGLSILFLEPSIKDDKNKYDKQLTMEMINILKSQIKK